MNSSLQSLEGFRASLVAWFSGLSRAQKIYVCIALLYLLTKLRRFISAFRGSIDTVHTQLHNPLSIESPPAHIFPQYFQNSKGLWLFHRDWILPQDVQLDAPKGVVIISHGLAEHIQRYEHLAKRLNRQGFAVYGHDHQGHGMSEGDRGYVRQFDDFVDDLLLFSNRISEEYPKLPLFLFGHSMGGGIATMAALRQPQLFNGGVILSSPAYASGPGATPDPQNPIFRAVLQRVAWMFPKLRIVDLDNSTLSHDPTVLYRLKRDPLHIHGLLPANIGSEILASFDRIFDNVKHIKFPFYIFGGSDDILVKPESWQRFYSETGTAEEDKEIRIFEGLYHETLNESEQDQQQVFNAMLKWMLQRCQRYVEC